MLLQNTRKYDAKAQQTSSEKAQTTNAIVSKGFISSNEFKINPQ